MDNRLTGEKWEDLIKFQGPSPGSKRLRTEGRSKRELLDKGNTEQGHLLNQRGVVQVVK
ncbi:MAG: hypothetical protein H6Q41_2556 [Deltaproteobacteria bacterium]|jgi:hypothetical protein|nr:hypothetical protein [Deltaproteobacteria bacterium]